MRVQPIKRFETYDWLKYKHYLHRIPPFTFAFGLFDVTELTGVVTYGVPASPCLCRGICGHRYRYDVLELNRLCLAYNRKNEASYLIAHSLKLLPKPKIVVSYADTAQHHVGYIYQASNFIYTGLTVKRTDPFVGDKHPRYYTDISRRQERSQKHRYVYFCGNKQQKKAYRDSFNYGVAPYPKGESRQYDDGYDVPTQAHMF